VFKTCYLTVRRFAPVPVLAWMDRVENSPSGSRLAHGVFWSGVGAVASRLLTLLATIVVAQHLGKSVFGELGIIQSTLSMFATFATFGVGLTATKHIAEYRQKDPERAGRVIALSNVVSLVCGCSVGLLIIVLAPWVARRCLEAPQLSGLIAISAAGLLFVVLNEAQVGTLSGLEAFRRQATIQAIGGGVAFPILVAGVHFFGLTGAVCALVANLGVLVFLNHVGIRKEAARLGISIVWKGCFQERGLIWRYNLPTLCCGAVYVPSMWLANMILVRMPGGYAEMGIFSAADRLRTAIMFLPGLLGGVALPMLASLSAKSDIGRYRKVFWANIAISISASLAVAVPIALAARWIMSSYGAGFAEGRWVLVLLCATAVTHAAYWIVSQSMVSKGRVWTMFTLNLGWAILLLSWTWILRHQGAKGLAVSYLIADSFRLIAALGVCRHLLARRPAQPEIVTDTTPTHS
jgi:O-antigen/teichoic acid export membrane protein